MCLRRWKLTFLLIKKFVTDFCEQRNMEYKILPFYCGEALLKCNIPIDVAFLTFSPKLDFNCSILKIVEIINIIYFKITTGIICVQLKIFFCPGVDTVLILQKLFKDFRDLFRLKWLCNVGERMNCHCFCNIFPIWSNID